MTFKHDPERAREAGRKGGRAKIPTKGFGSMTPEQRQKAARKAVYIRWYGSKDKKEGSNGSKPSGRVQSRQNQQD